MKSFKNIFLTILALGTSVLYAGNPERVGQAGATQLLINPYARSSGFHGINISNSYGIESVINNPAGLAKTKKTEFVFAHTRYLVGTDININALGFSQSLKKGGVIGISVVSFDMGEFVRTTVDQPDGTLGTFKPTIMNIGLSYAKTFVDDRIFVGATFRMIHESITDVSANGMSFDAGVQYSDKANKFKIGVSLKNVGPEMKFAGDGLSQRAYTGGTNSTYTSNVTTSAAKFQLPAVLNIGTSYDFKMGADSLGENAQHRVTPMATFISNAFARDQIGLGVEYGFKKYLMLRAAFVYEKGIFKADERLNAYTGFAGGVTFEIPFKTGENKYSTFGLDYSYRSTNPFNGTHSFGCRVNL